VKSKRITALALGLAVMLTLFVSGSVFGCILGEGASCVFPSPDIFRIPGGGAGRNNAMLGPDAELVRLQSDLIAFINAKLRGETPSSTSELIALSQQLLQKSDAELASLLALAKTLDTGNTPLHTRSIKILMQEQTRRRAAARVARERWDVGGFGRAASVVKPVGCA